MHYVNCREIPGSSYRYGILMSDDSKSFNGSVSSEKRFFSNGSDISLDTTTSSRPFLNCLAVWKKLKNHFPAHE